jgi:hypothetical protein
VILFFLFFYQKSHFRWLLFVRNSGFTVDVDRHPRTAAPTGQFRGASREPGGKKQTKIGSSGILAILYFELRVATWLSFCLVALAAPCIQAGQSINGRRGAIKAAVLAARIFYF